MIVFDVSRLVTRSGRLTPTGIDRVELAYARHLIAAATPLAFVRTTGWGGLALLPRRAVEGYVEALAVCWREGGNLRRRARVQWAGFRLRLPRLPRRRLFKARERPGREKPVYLLVSHHHLEKRHLVARLKRRHDAFFVCLIHDLIPIQFPEYVRPGNDKRHLRRIETAAKLADAVIVPSEATAEAIRPYIAGTSRAQPILVARFGVELPSIVLDEPPLPERPYFVCLGTVEARKNHLLLLNLWREIVVQNAKQAPGLVLIGRRGWEIENTIDMLSRCPALHGIVSERGRASDIETVRMLKNARALLLPSYAEGFGFPLIEALASGNPVLCSDLPALREIGGAIPEYFDPLDGHAWRAAILDYAYDPAPRREAQLQRLSKWRAPCWSDHFAAVEALVADITGAPQ